MRVLHRVTVFDAADVSTESQFWAAVLGGEVWADEGWHNVLVDAEWVLGIQSAPNHVPPQWPDGDQQQQIHLDLHVDDLASTGRQVLEFGGRELAPARRPDDNLDGAEAFATYASPAGHPFCLCVGTFTPPDNL